MHFDTKRYLQQYDKTIQDLYMQLEELLMYSCPGEDIDERMYAKLPSYYVGEKFVRLIPFRDHINIEASAVKKYENQLRAYKVTSKGMLQITPDQKKPECLPDIFWETLVTR